MKKLTLKEVYSKYGNVEFEFNSYYKFRFTFRANFGGKGILVDFGGSGDDIYKFEVMSGCKEKLNTIDCEIVLLSVIENGEMVEQYIN